MSRWLSILSEMQMSLENSDVGGQHDMIQLSSGYGKPDLVLPAGDATCLDYDEYAAAILARLPHGQCLACNPSKAAFLYVLSAHRPVPRSEHFISARVDPAVWSSIGHERSCLDGIDGVLFERAYLLTKDQYWAKARRIRTICPCLEQRTDVRVEQGADPTMEFACRNRLLFGQPDHRCLSPAPKSRHIG